MRSTVAYKPIKALTRDQFYTRLLTAEEFLQMYNNDRDNIQSARPVPAPLGSKGTLGHILVRTKRPRYPRLPPRLYK